MSQRSSRAKRARKSEIPSGYLEIFSVAPQMEAAGKVA